jgi:hypothetical protein
MWSIGDRRTSFMTSAMVIFDSLTYAATPSSSRAVRLGASWATHVQSEK